MPSHYIPGPDDDKPPVVEKDPDVKGKWYVKPRALQIMWGGDPRYWTIPPANKPTDTVELLQVSWLEVTGSLDLTKLEPDRNYKVSFKLKLKSDAFGWNDSPIYFMAKPGKNERYIWKKSNLSLEKPGKEFSVPHDPVLKFKTPSTLEGDKLQFGMYEIWNGSWKGGLIIHEVVIEPSTD